LLVLAGFPFFVLADFVLDGTYGENDDGNQLAGEHTDCGTEADGEHEML